ncbi:MAG: hypothetical protein ABR903_07125 [Thermodesulfovibrionales bacterium]|jgi:hypothetical protein
MAQRFINGSVGETFVLDEKELDIIRSFLVYTLKERTSIDREDIYAYGNGKKILWS